MKALTLKELRLRRGLTQRQLATALGITQSRVSQIERQTDAGLNSVRSFVAGLGGELEVVVVFPDGSETRVVMA